MLYDPKWEQETKADPFSLESLIAWLEKQPREIAYDWHNCDGMCLVGQYGTAMGLKDLTSDSEGLARIFGGWNGSPGALYSEICNGALSGEKNTFGAALERARKVARS